MPASAIPLSKTKVIVPTRRPEILTRPRLLELLYDLLDKKLILVSAPAGYGKTSLLIDLAQQVEIPLCWLSLDTLDQEPQRFIAYFIAAIAQRFPGFGGQSTAALNNLTSLEGDTERLVVTLVNEIYEQVREHFVLVLDDYHLVDSVPAIQNFLARFLQLVDENCHLILSARTLITMPDMPLMVARDQVGGLSFSELAFQVEEIQALFTQNYHMGISESAAQELAQETEGWITGLQLSNLTVTHGMADRLRVARTSGVGLFDYLGQQVLEQQPPELRDFLLRSSLLDEFDAELCEAVLGPLSKEPRNWQELIATVQRNNLFVLPVGAEGKWLRYHHLFQDFLRSWLEEEHPDLVKPVLYRLAEVHEQHNEWEKAHQIYQELGDIESQANLVERVGSIIFHQDRRITLSHWLDTLPESLLKRRPVLLSLQGTLRSMKGELKSGLSLLDQAEAALRSQEDVHNLALTLVRRAIAYRFLGNYAASLADADEALKLTEKDNALQVIRAEAQRAKGLSFYQVGETKQAIEWLEHSLALYTHLNEARSIPILRMELGMAYRAVGNYKAAEDYYQKALTVWQNEGNLHWQANLMNNLGVLYHLLGQYEQAILSLEQSLIYAQKSGYVAMEAFTLTSLGDLYAELDEFEASNQAYQQAQSIAERITNQFLINYLSLAQAAIARSQRDFVQAHQLLTDAQGNIDENGSSYERGLFHLERGRLVLVEGDVQQAIADLQEAQQLFAGEERHLESAWCLLWLAAAHVSAGDTAAARGKIQHLITLQDQSAPSFGAIARQVRPWLAELRDDPEAGRAVRLLLDQASQTETQLPDLRRRLRRMTRALPLSSPRLNIQTFGQAQVRINGKLVTTSQWQTQMVRDLFFYFLAASRPVTKEQVGTAFWPDISPAQLKMRFRNNIYRLRHALGQETILFEDELYRFNRALDYEYDVEAFGAYLAQAGAAQDIQERIACYQAAVDLVRGPYLANIDATWVLPERERLSRAYLSALIQLAELHLKNGGPRLALEVCQRGISWDDCYEEAHRLAMQIYDLLGDHAAVVRQYQDCQQALMSELKVTPSPETEKLYRRLIS